MKKIRAILDASYWFVASVFFLVIIIIGIILFKNFIDLFIAFIIIIASLSESYFLIMYLNYYDKKHDIALIRANNKIKKVNNEIRLRNDGIKSKKEYEEYIYVSPTLNVKWGGIVCILYILYFIVSIFFPKICFIAIIIIQPIIILRYRTNSKKKMVFRNEPYLKEEYVEQKQVS